MKKLTQSELKSLSNLKSQSDSITQVLATAALEKELAIRKANAIIEQSNVKFENLLKQAQADSTIVGSKMDDLVKEFNSKYGDSEYNPETGEIFPRPIEEETKK